MASVVTAKVDRLVIHGGEPLHRPPLRCAWPPRDEHTRAAILQAFADGNWAYARDGFQDQLAQRFAVAHGARHGIFLANGTSSLLAALIALGVSRSDEVVVPAFTCPTTILPILLLGAVPIPVDIEPQTLCLSAKGVEDAMTSKTRAIIAVHMYSALCDLEALTAISERHRVALIEDCAHVPGAMGANGPVGSSSDIGFFSFQAKKTISAGEGAIAITSDADLYERIHRVVHVGKPLSVTAATSAELSPILAMNLASTTFQAALVSAQFDNLPKRLERYVRTFREIEKQTQQVSGIRLQQAGTGVKRRSFNKLCFIFDGGPLGNVPLPTIIQAAKAEGLPIRKTYGAVHRDPRVRRSLIDLGWEDGAYPVAELVATGRTAVLDHWWLGESEEVASFIGCVLERLCAHSQALIDRSD